MSMKYYYCKEMGAVYFINGVELYQVPMWADGTFSFDEAASVEFWEKDLPVTEEKVRAILVPFGRNRDMAPDALA